MNNNTTVVSFYYKHKPGGFTKRLYRAYSAIATANKELHYFSIEKLPVEHQNIIHHPVKVNAKEGTIRYWIEYYVKAALQARKFTKSNVVSSFCVFSFFYSTLACLTGLGLGKQTLVFIRADDLHDSRLKSLAWLRVSIHALLEKISMRCASKVICTNKNLIQVIANRTGYADKLSYLPNDIPLTHHFVKPNDDTNRDFIFVTAAVINPRKNQLYALQALAQMKVTNWQYLLVGSDVENTGYEEQLRDYVEKHDLQDKVEFLGWRDDVSKVIAGCDLFLLPTTMEGSPNSLLEALGTGISCLGSNIPEVSEMLDHSKLCFDLNDVTSLTMMLESYCQSRSYRKDIQQKTASCKINYEFDWDKKIVEFVDRMTSSAIPNTTTTQLEQQ